MWTVRTSSRRPTSCDSGPTYSIAAVTRQAPMSRPVVRCTQRVDRPNRTTVSDGACVAVALVSAGALIVAAVRLADPGVDVVAQVLPVTGLDPVDDLDAAEPLAGLVPVHRGGVEPDGTAVLVGDRLVVHLRGDQHVRP